MRVKKWKLMKRNYFTYVQQIIWAIGLAGWLSMYLPFQVKWLFFGMAFVVIEGVVIVTDRYKKMPITYVVLLAAIMGSLWLIQKSGQCAENDIRSAYHWLLTYDGTEEAYEVLYTRICMLGLIFGCSIVSYLGNKLKLLRRGWMICCIVILVMLCIQEKNLPRIGIICLMGYILMELVGIQHEKRYGKESAETWKVVYTLTPVIILVMSLCSLLPRNEKPISWAWVGKVYQNIKMGMQDVGAEMAFAIGSKQDEFFLNFWGMEKEKKLKNDLHQSQEVMFKAKSNALPHQNVYLAGSYKETYLGDGWKSEGKDKEGLLSDNELDAYELLYGLSGEKVENEEEKLISEKKIKVTYEGIRTKTAFIPAKMESLVKVEGKNSLEVRSDGMFFSKRQRRGSDYLVTFLEMNTESEWFQNRVREMEHFSYQKDRSMSKEAFLDQYRGIVDTKWLEAVLEKPQLNEQLKKRNEQIYETYTTLPKSLPERVKQLTLDVTQNAQTRYDKLKCIEAYLKTYHYTEAPGEMPNGNDFVDYFLFESQEGYCTYFASAMAVMARSIGIPTRYVEGFIVDYSQLPKGEKTVLVNGRQAHAWVEAYLDRI